MGPMRVIPGPKRLDVVSANLHVVSRHQAEAAAGIAHRVRGAFGRWPDVIGTQEALRLDVKTVGRYRVVKTDRKSPHDNTNAILVKRWVKVLSSSWHPGAPAFGDGLNHNPRHYHLLTYRRRGRNFAHIDTHLSVIREPHGRVEHVDHVEDPVARTHGQMAVKVVEQAERLRKAGYVVSVTADSNDNTDWSFALAVVLERNGYIVVRNHIDLVAVHKSQARHRHGGRVVVGKSITRSDHEAVGASFDLL